jgi:hypothetical protein
MHFFLEALFNPLQSESISHYFHLLRAFCIFDYVYLDFFLRQVLLCSPDWTWTQDSPISASQELGLQTCTTTPSSYLCYFLITSFIVDCEVLEVKISLIHYCMHRLCCTYCKYFALLIFRWILHVLNWLPVVFQIKNPVYIN